MPPPPSPTQTPPQDFFSTVLNPAAANTPATTTTPPRPTSRAAPTAANATTSSTPTAAPPPFTPAQRSLQARGKSHSNTAAGEAYESRQQREQAANILGSLELLLWYSAARNESLTQTRHYFQNIVFGLPPPASLWKDEYEIPVEQRVRTSGDVVMGGTEGSPARAGRAKGKEKDRERGKRKS